MGVIATRFLISTPAMRTGLNSLSNILDQPPFIYTTSC